MREITKERIAELRTLRQKAHRWWASTVPVGQHDDYKSEAIPKFCTEVSKLLDDLDRALEPTIISDPEHPDIEVEKGKPLRARKKK